VRIGVPTEVKSDEYRVGLTPAGARELVDRGHSVHVQAGAGEGSGIGDDEYRAGYNRMLWTAPLRKWAAYLPG